MIRGEWSEKEINLLKQIYPSHTNLYTSNQIGKTPGQVAFMAK